MRETLHAAFADRHVAGQALAARLGSLEAQHPVVVGLARGGIPVAFELAQALRAPLDLLIVRKIGVPGNPELGIGAVAEGDELVLDHEAVQHLRVSEQELAAAVARGRAEVRARVERFRAGHPPLAVTGRTVIVVDDGLATGGTARAALRALRARGPRRLILAVPVGAADAVAALHEEADDVVSLISPELMVAVGLWYEHFEPTQDAEIDALLDRAGAQTPPPSYRSREVRIPVAEIVGDLILPDVARGLVILAHDSGSSRFSSRNRQLARALNGRGLATLLLDLVRWEEERDWTNVFDVDLLCERLVAATRWARTQADLTELPIGYFGAGTGAGAALRAAAALGGEIAAVVSRGGRPDLAGPVLPDVRAPVLLIVGERDEIVLDLNREAHSQLRAPSKLAIVPGATHLFEEPAALKEVSRLATDWFACHLIPVTEQAA